MNKQELISAIEAVDALEKKWKYSKFLNYFTDKGITGRTKYPKHIEFFKAGLDHNIRGFVGGNGTGKTTCGGYELYLHLSGKYPIWWEGHRFKDPINAWACAREGKQLREGIQESLFGGITDEDIGTGLIAREDLLDDKGILQKWAHPGQANCIGTVLVRHYTNGIYDGWSKCEFKTYAQGWAEFQGPTRQLIWLDEEPDDSKIYAECLMRLRPKDGGMIGHLMATFTPTQGYSNTYLAFVPGGVFPENGEHIENPCKYTVQVRVSEVPHLPDEYIKSMIEELKISDPNNIEARMDGVAAMGSGRVYPISEEFIKCPKQPVPTFWKKAYGMDPGQANFACVWIAEDPNTNVKYVYDEYKHGKVVYIIHVEAIKARGDWLKGGLDPQEAVKPRDTGETIHSYFNSSGLDLMAAKGDPNALRARIRSMLEAGSLRIMDNCTRLLQEIRTYRYDPNDPNKIARNQEDHLCDALMYGLCVFDSIAQSYAEVEEETYKERENKRNRFNDDGRSSITGY